MLNKHLNTAAIQSASLLEKKQTNMILTATQGHRLNFILSLGFQNENLG